MLMRTTSEGIHSSINLGYFELNDIPYLIQEIFFIVFRYGVFAASELHFTKIVRPVRLTFQQQVNLSTPSVGTFPAPTIIPVDRGYTQGVLDLGQVFHTKQFKGISCPCVESRSTVNGIPYSLLCLFALYEAQIEQRKEVNQLIDRLHTFLAIAWVRPDDA